jgi:mRNA interferase HigB
VDLLRSLYVSALSNWYYSKAKPLNDERIRFEICGGNYRLIVAFKFSAKIAFIKFIGTHEEYDRIDALTVDRF